MKWILVIILAIVLQQFLPWWSIAIAGFIYGFFIQQSAKTAFINGFFGIFMFWGSVAGYVYYVNNGLLAGLLADLMYMPPGILMVALTGVTGGLIAGLSSLSGKYLRDLSHLQISPLEEK
ncbi:MAG: hypothetical protein EA361_03450 [Bacteroidetes bacterium]|nr:MAG: hypothetical protein EA361_03450 [Bacteroidota bacterium]